ncbi:hypothetical protein KZ820_11720 [Sphingomonas sp. RRHST34]|uniref:Cytosolic endo-beta-N-acetylglucosaminidase TIM barrel domain-containing protein n=1 Tax=Sphingomonas citri TaxID=2862499 RepID=A0ABS7BPL4_9SPHN|nr:hypothetical protein [Sphingomonas citri]MBW6531402.1 hypothetical protein [Sphingomonas citri]
MADQSSTDSAVAVAHGTAAIARREVVLAGLGLLSSASLAAVLGGGRDSEVAAAGTEAVAAIERRPPGAGSVSPGAVSGAAPILPMLPGSTADAFARLMAYDPAADPDAAYFRSAVPLAPRIAPFAATQAHPRLDPRAGAATLATTNRTIAPDAPDVWRAVRHATTPAGGVQVARRLGVHDIVVQWGGTGIVPNPALTDAAHRNGALCLGTIWQPDARLFDGSVVPVERVAEKLVALARYFGFDGYFVNHELGSAQAKAQVAGLMAAMHAVARRARVAPFHLQHYDGHGDLRDLFAPDASGAPAADTVMIDQGWSGYNGPGGCCTSWPADPATLAAGASAFQRTPADVFFGLQLYPGPGFIGAAAPRVISPDGGSGREGGTAGGGLQLYSVDDGCLNLWRARQAGRGAAFLDAAADVATVERLVYSGQTQNPALSNAPSAAQQAVYDSGRLSWGDTTLYRLSEWATTDGTLARFSPDQADLPITYGVANFIAERSVIGAAPFATHFNEGEGQAFFVEGRRVSDTAWFNLGIQDVLPTWQWWRAPFEGLTDRAAEAPGLLEVGLDQAIAYDGGSSLRVYGLLGVGAATRVHLFKTDIAVAGATAVELVTLARAADRARTRLGLIFADRPDRPEWLPLPPGWPAAGEGGWTLSRLDLGRFSGRRMASILLGFEPGDGGAAPLDLRVGRFAITGEELVSLAPPRGLRLDRRVTDAATGAIGLGLRWEDDGRFDVFRVDAQGGARRWLGRIDGRCFYAPAALPAGTESAIIEVQAIGDGRRGGAARLRV